VGGAPGVTAIADLLSRRDRDRLAARMRELGELARLARERGRQVPAPPPKPLHELAREHGVTEGNRDSIARLPGRDG
jgi:hypothetical protein